MSVWVSSLRFHWNKVDPINEEFPTMCLAVILKKKKEKISPTFVSMFSADIRK